MRPDDRRCLITWSCSATVSAMTCAGAFSDIDSGAGPFSDTANGAGPFSATWAGSFSAADNGAGPFSETANGTPDNPRTPSAVRQSAW